ncbi:MAG: hypothetical protein MZV63_33920 [Marinilabiliales bacterium]|nr:hypothetical protein [Marinilabiliales bacterium]
MNGTQRGLQVLTLSLDAGTARGRATCSCASNDSRIFPMDTAEPLASMLRVRILSLTESLPASGGACSTSLTWERTSSRPAPAWLRLGRVLSDPLAQTDSWPGAPGAPAAASPTASSPKFNGSRRRRSLLARKRGGRRRVGSWSWKRKTPIAAETDRWSAAADSRRVAAAGCAAARQDVSGAVARTVRLLGRAGHGRPRDYDAAPGQRDQSRDRRPAPRAAGLCPAAEARGRDDCPEDACHGSRGGRARTRGDAAGSPGRAPPAYAYRGEQRGRGGSTRCVLIEQGGAPGRPRGRRVVDCTGGCRCGGVFRRTAPRRRRSPSP